MAPLGQESYYVAPELIENDETNILRELWEVDRMIDNAKHDAVEELWTDLLHTDQLINNIRCKEGNEFEIIMELLHMDRLVDGVTTTPKEEGLSDPYRTVKEVRKRPYDEKEMEQVASLYKTDCRYSHCKQIEERQDGVHEILELLHVDEWVDDNRKKRYEHPILEELRQTDVEFDKRMHIDRSKPVLVVERASDEVLMSDLLATDQLVDKFAVMNNPITQTLCNLFQTDRLVDTGKPSSPNPALGEMVATNYCYERDVLRALSIEKQISDLEEDSVFEKDDILQELWHTDLQFLISQQRFSPYNRILKSLWEVDRWVDQMQYNSEHVNKLDPAIRELYHMDCSIDRTRMVNEENSFMHMMEDLYHTDRLVDKQQHTAAYPIFTDVNPVLHNKSPLDSIPQEEFLPYAIRELLWVDREIDATKSYQESDWDLLESLYEMDRLVDRSVEAPPEPKKRSIFSAQEKYMAGLHSSYGSAEGKGGGPGTPVMKRNLKTQKTSSKAKKTVGPKKRECVVM